MSTHPKSLMGYPVVESKFLPPNACVILGSDIAAEVDRKIGPRPVKDNVYSEIFDFMGITRKSLLDDIYNSSPLDFLGKNVTFKCEGMVDSYDFDEFYRAITGASSSANASIHTNMSNPIPFSLRHARSNTDQYASATGNVFEIERAQADKALKEANEKIETLLAQVRSLKADLTVIERLNDDNDEGISQVVKHALANAS